MAFDLQTMADLQTLATEFKITEIMDHVLDCIVHLLVGMFTELQGLELVIVRLSFNTSDQLTLMKQEVTTTAVYLFMLVVNNLWLCFMFNSYFHVHDRCFCNSKSKNVLSAIA